MNTHHSTGLVVLLGIIGIALLGGFNASQHPQSQDAAAQTQAEKTPEQQKAELQQKLSDLQTQLTIERDKETYSPYHGIVHLNYISRSQSADQEYASIRVDQGAASTTTVPLAGWTLHSASTGQTVSIPGAAALYFSNSINSESPIVLSAGDTLYLITGHSPNGASFRLNKCSGYLSQFQSFVPYISTSCPAPRDEDLSSIPHTVNNDACFDYIDSFPTCRVQTDNLPASWSQQCTKFIYEKITYGSCIATHKNDADFYLHDWRVYLKRTEPIWKDRREEVILSDQNGKIVDDLKY
jgi:hypothetical protein